MAESKVEMKNYMDKLSTANNYFGVNLHLLLARENKNVFFSPFSVSVAMSMLYTGTKEKTAMELEHALGFRAAELNEEEIHLGFDQLLSMLLKDQESCTLAIANAIVSQKDFVLFPEYKAYLQKIYRAISVEVDFVKESACAVKQINDWVKENTKGKILKLFDAIDPSTVMILLNAVYFKGTWKSPFDKRDTSDGLFYNHGIEAGAKNVPLMHLEKVFYFIQKENYKVLELPYVGDDIAMLLLLPSKKDGLNALESNLTADFFNNIRGELFKTKVEVTIPKLHLEYTKELRSALMELGINLVFDCSANFKGLSDSDGVMVSEVIHKAVLDVNEEGSEAAAVTAVMMVGCCAGPVPPVPVFKADHPFLFAIYDKRTHLILFMGRVEEL